MSDYFREILFALLGMSSVTCCMLAGAIAIGFPVFLGARNSLEKGSKRAKQELRACTVLMLGVEAGAATIHLLKICQVLILLKWPRW